MQEPAKCLAAELVVVLRVQDEFVPQVVRRLRRHRHEAVPASQVGEKKLPQAARDQGEILALELGPSRGELVVETLGETVGADEFRALEYAQGKQNDDCRE